MHAYEGKVLDYPIEQRCKECSSNGPRIMSPYAEQVTATKRIRDTRAGERLVSVRVCVVRVRARLCSKSTRLDWVRGLAFVVRSNIYSSAWYRWDH
eukprot:1599712-Pleurochrysis_carterae.AAC.1